MEVIYAINGRLGAGRIGTTSYYAALGPVRANCVGASTLGYYAQAYKVAQWPTGLVTHIVSHAALPTYAKLQNDPLWLGKAFEMTLWLILPSRHSLCLRFLCPPACIYSASYRSAAKPICSGWIYLVFGKRAECLTLQLNMPYKHKFY